MSAIREDNSDKIGAPAKSPPPPKDNTLNRLQQTNLHLWLTNNVPRDVEELKAVRYALYHRCNRADFKVTDKQDVDDFTLSGRQSSVHVVSNELADTCFGGCAWPEQGWVRWGRSRASYPSRVTLL